MKGDAAVHHQQLPMVAHVEKRHAPGQPGVQEARRRHAAAAHAIEMAGNENSRCRPCPAARAPRRRAGRPRSRRRRIRCPPHRRGKYRTAMAIELRAPAMAASICGIGGIAALQHRHTRLPAVSGLPVIRAPTSSKKRDICSGAVGRARRLTGRWPGLAPAGSFSRRGASPG